MTGYETLESPEYLSDIADEEQMDEFHDDVLVSVGFRSQEGDWKEAYLQSDPDGEFLTYKVDDFGKQYSGDTVDVHRSKVVNRVDTEQALQELDPEYSPAVEGTEELEDLF
jgi:hypothetical protein